MNEASRCAVPSNNSFDGDTRQHCAAQRVNKRPQRGAVLGRAGQLNR